MKNLYFHLIFSLLLCSGSLSAQIPNYSFEDWTTVGTYQVPQLWGTLNEYTATFNVFTATKGTPGNPGNSYLKLTSKALPSKVVVPGLAVSGILDAGSLTPLSGFPFNQRPEKLTGKWQYMAFGPEAGFIAIYLTKWNSNLNHRDTVALRNYSLPGMVMSWGTFNISLTYLNGNYPDTALIILSSSGPTPYADSYLYVDNLTFTGSVAGIEENSSTERLVILENPSIGDISCRCNLTGLHDTKITLLDVMGNLIETIRPADGSKDLRFTFNATNLKKGVYFIRLQSGKLTEVRKVILL